MPRAVPPGPPFDGVLFSLQPSAPTAPLCPSQSLPRVFPVCVPSPGDTGMVLGGGCLVGSALPGPCWVSSAIPRDEP